MDKQEKGFWRVASPSLGETDVGSWLAAKKTLGLHLREYPEAYHWMAYGYNNENGNFIADESTFIEID